MMKRRRMTIDEIRDEFAIEPEMRSWGICALVDVENMGFCADGVTRWYTFYDKDGNPAVYYKY